MQKQLPIFLSLIISPLIAVLTLTACNPGKSAFDLQGGSQLTIRLKPTQEHPNITKSDLNAVQKTIESRINGLGVSQAIIQAAGKDRILVQLPSVKDARQAERVLGGTAQIEFREQKAGTEEQLAAEMAVLQAAKSKQANLKKSPTKQATANNLVAIDKQYTEIGKLFDKAVLSGGHLRNAVAQPLSGEGWEIAIDFDDFGSDAFAKLTKKLAGTGRSIGVFIDNVPISTPTVGAMFADAGITGGKAVITGNFTAENANDLAIQLRSGSLPVPVEVIENQTISPK